MEPFEKTKKVIKVKVLMSLLVVFLLGIGVMTSELFGMEEVLGEVKMTIQENAIPGKPLGIDIVAISKIPFKDGHVELIIPVIGNMPERKVRLWSGTSNTPTAKHLHYVLPILPIGEYKIIGLFEFKSLLVGARDMRVSTTLYINVRSDKILASNISFRKTKKEVLKNESKEIKHIEQADKQGNNKPQNKKSKIKKAPLESSKKFASVPGHTQGRETIDNEKLNRKLSKIKKAPLVSLKKIAPVSGQIQGRETTDNEKIHRKSFRVKKAPLVSSKKIASVSIQQKDSIRKTGLISKKAPLESTKKVSAISTGEEKEKKNSKSKSSNYSQSAEALEKKRALEGGEK